MKSCIQKYSSFVNFIDRACTHFLGVSLGCDLVGYGISFPSFYITGPKLQFGTEARRMCVCKCPGFSLHSLGEKVCMGRNLNESKVFRFYRQQQLMSENRLARVERDVQSGDAGVCSWEMGVVSRSDRYRWHRLEAILRGWQGW